MITNISLSQSQQNIAGVYNRSSNDPHGASYLFVLEDHKFVVTYVGGVLVGSWTIDHNQVEFKPFIREQHFMVYGRYNKDLKDSSRVYFQDFSEQETFIGFGQQEGGKVVLKRVFNPSANCVPYPSVARFKGVLPQVLLSDQPYHFEDEPSEPKAQRNIYTFGNTRKYNDFIAYYFKDDAEKNPFYAVLKGGTLVFGNDDIAEKQPLPAEGEDKEFIDQVAHAPQSTDKVLYNPFYNRSNADINDTYNWKFDEKKNAYINFLNYVEGEEYRPDEQEAYNRMNILYQFEAVPISTKVIQPFAIDNKPLFVATCDQLEKE